MLKYSRTEMSTEPNVHVLKCLHGQKVHMPKCLWCQNVLAPISLDKMLGAKISPSRIEYGFDSSGKVYTTTLETNKQT